MSLGSLHIKHGSLALLAAAAIAASSASQAAEGAGGMRVVRDTETGQLRGPTPEEFKAMQAQEAQAKRLTRQVAPTAPVSMQHANGAVGVRPTEDTMTYSVIKRNADGTMTTQCVTGAETASKVLKAPQAATAATDKEHGHAHQ